MVVADSATSNAILTSPARETPTQIQRLVDWNTDVLLKLLKQLVLKRKYSNKKTWNTLEEEPKLPQDEYYYNYGENPNDGDDDDRKVVLDEVTDVIHLPGFHGSSMLSFGMFTDPDISPLAVAQLGEFVTVVANAYHSNPFHCLQHASQVTMAVSKLLSRIIVKNLDDVDEDSDEDDDDSDDSNNSEEVAAAAAKEKKENTNAAAANGDDDVEDDDDEPKVTDAIAGHLHNHTYGITSDPLCQFALVLAAFVHAVDHKGVPNEQIIVEEADEALKYKNRSITEQRSVDKIWKKLMEPNFVELRKCIYCDMEEKQRFRQVLVNSVLATDIDDEELQNLRMKRWQTTFQRQIAADIHPTPEDVHRKATIVLEHLMQTADIFHYMQPWIIYQKWSSRKLEEQYVAYKAGRTTNGENPATSWYDNELDFFDNYAIPLAMQLKDCDAFVVSSDEYLNYALENRRRWASDGKEWATQLVAKLEDNTNHSKGGGTRRLSLRRVFSTDKENGQGGEAMISEELPPQVQRLVDWNFEMLQQLLKQIVAKRIAQGKSGRPTGEIPVLPPMEDGQVPLDEVVDVISLDAYDASVATPDQLDPNSVELSLAAVAQLRDYVTDISCQFRDNPFHCLDHGSHVCMTARKLISRMITSASVNEGNGAAPPAEEVHNRTFGISSDPLAQFAVVFAALIHDADHNGVPNSQLLREEDPLAIKYKGQSVLEQNSIDVAFGHLMLPGFEDLRACIYADEEELKRFRQIVVNAVLATDANNRYLMPARKARFEDSFNEKAKADTSKAALDKKATVALEILMASSDVFHATQNWHLYQKWSERLFQETYAAYQSGRLSQDPSVIWYKSELLFFDDHVIPLARQMAECGLFGVSGDELLVFALANRQQWAAKGGDLVASMMARYHGKEVERARARRRHRRLSLSAQQA